jgi:YVTN family beta-propeller protein
MKRKGNFIWSIFSMRKLILLFCLSPALLFAQTASELQSKRITLPNGWSLSPAGASLPLGDLPLNIAVAPNKKFIAVTNNGQSKQSIQLIDTKAHLVLDAKEIGKAWLGLVFSDDSKTLYVSGGNDNWIVRYEIKAQKLLIKDTIIIGKPWPEKISVAGLALDDKASRLYVVTKENNSLYVVDTKTKGTIKRIALNGEAYTCILSPDKKLLYISCWGCDKVIVMNTQQLTITTEIPVGDNPNDMVLTKRGNYLLVANANDNSVSVIDIKKNKVVEVLNAALYPNAPSGSTTNSVALSEDEKILYIANADNNCLVVFDFSKPGNSQSRGFIPVGWYPTCVRTIGNQILVANGKGASSFANPNGPSPVKKKQEVAYQKGDTQKPVEVQYIGGLFKGTLSMIPIPDEKSLAVYSQAVYANTPYNKESETESKGMVGNPIPMKRGEKSPIKYVFYVIKENRTYDQVLGDVPEGNGDSSLVLFGKKVTPNQHALAKQFVLFDNFYVNGEVSADGHNWSLGAYATDYLEKTWVTSYGGRGGSYDAEGNRAIANNKNGYLWDICKRQGVSYRTYGEFADGGKANIPSLIGHVCAKYTGWDESVRDTARYYQWRKDFDSLLAINQVPQLNTLRIINDHTEGLRLGKPTPKAHVADNDYAVGLFVEHLSKSKIWNESAVFIVEDDAQNGPDHVDAHRSTLYVAGGFVKRQFVDHTMYSTASVLRTIEQILGLPPMSQYDAAAETLWRSFTDTPNSSTFKSVAPEIDLSERNTAMNEWQRKSESFDFRKEDSIPDDAFNEVLWYAIKGSATKCPAPRHAAFFKVSEIEEDE